MSSSQESNIQYVIRARLEGVPVKTIANNLGISRSYVYAILGVLPKSDGSEILDTHLPLDKQYEVAAAYVSKYSQWQKNRKKGQTQKDEVEIALIEEVSNELQVPKEEIYAVLYRMTTLHPSALEFPLYSNIEKWKTRKILSVRGISKCIGIPTQELTEILHGWRHLPLKYAQKLKRVSGLTIREIYADLLRIDEEEGRGKHAQEG